MNHPAISLLPFLFFLGFYLILGTLFGIQNITATSCALFAFMGAMGLFRTRFEAILKSFIQGIAQETAVVMILIFLLAGAFSSLTQSLGSVQATVHLALWVFPAGFLLPGLFLTACLISFALGTSMGTIATLTPIGLGLCEPAGISIPLMLGTIVGGAMFGDNLSLISDTTIAATLTQDCAMSDKMKENLKLALPSAAIISMVLFLLHPPAQTFQTEPFSLIQTAPYLLVFILALMGIHVIKVLAAGILFTFALLIFHAPRSFLDGLLAIQTGFLSMSEVMILTLFSAGLSGIARAEGGIHWFINRISGYIQTQKTAQLACATIISLVDICVANNTVAILIAGPMIKELGERFKLSKAHLASLIDIYSCTFQGLLPYGAQLLLVSSLAKISPFEIIPYTWYPILLGIMTTCWILLKKPESSL